MKVKVHRVNQQGHLETLGDEELTALGPEDEVSRWVDIESAEPEKLERLLAPLDLHPMVLENCLSQSSVPRVISYERAVFPYQLRGSVSLQDFICKTTIMGNIHRNGIDQVFG